MRETAQINECEANCKGNRLFGTSGIRGVFNQSLTVELCRYAAMALGTCLSSFANVCIATDTRESGPAIKEAVSAGLVSAGINVTDLGVLPTPALALLTRDVGFATGIMITASHNPAEYNGIKLFNSNGMGYSKSQGDRIEEICYSQTFRKNTARGKLKRMDSAKDVYFHSMRESFAGNGLNHNLKLVVDPGNGAASAFASELLASLGLDIVPLNDMPDGRFPGRHPEPREDTLHDTVKCIKESDAELAVCFDGDADRAVFCDRGGFLGYNEMIAYLSRIALGNNRRRKLVATVDTGRLLDLAVADLGGEVMRSPTGDISVAHLAKQVDAAIGVEPVGVYIQPEAGYFPDPIFATLTLLCHLKEAFQIRDFFKKMPSLYFSKSKIPCPNHMKSAIIRNLVKNADSLGARSICKTDGLKMEYDDAWMLLRASGTEPAIRVVAESTSPQQTAVLIIRGAEFVEDAFKDLGKCAAS